MREQQAKHPENAREGERRRSRARSSRAARAGRPRARDRAGVPTKGSEGQVEMLMESDDPEDAQGQQVSTVVNTDQWIAEDIPGYSEIRQFYLKMAKEMDWVPGQVMQGTSQQQRPGQPGGTAQAQRRPHYGDADVSYTSMSPRRERCRRTARRAAGTASTASAEHDDDAIPTTASGAVMKGLGGMFRRRKNNSSNSNSRAAGFRRRRPGLNSGIVDGYADRSHELFQRQPGRGPVRSARGYTPNAKRVRMMSSVEALSSRITATNRGFMIRFVAICCLRREDYRDCGKVVQLCYDFKFLSESQKSHENCCCRENLCICDAPCYRSRAGRSSRPIRSRAS